MGKNNKFNIPLGLDLFKKKGLKIWFELFKKSDMKIYKIEDVKKNIPIFIQEELTILLANMISKYGGVYRW